MRPGAAPGQQFPSNKIPSSCIARFHIPLGFVPKPTNSQQSATTRRRLSRWLRDQLDYYRDTILTPTGSPRGLLGIMDHYRWFIQISEQPNEQLFVGTGYWAPILRDNASAVMTRASVGSERPTTFISRTHRSLLAPPLETRQCTPPLGEGQRQQKLPMGSADKSCWSLRSN